MIFRPSSKRSRNRDVLFFSDEVYNRIIYDEPHVSIASFPGMKERTILLDGFSKTYAMTGWRMGYGVMPTKLAEHVHEAHGQLQFVYGCLHPDCRNPSASSGCEAGPTKW